MVTVFKRLFCLGAIFLVHLLFVTSCATSYHSRGILNTGFNDIRLGRDRFIITFRGNQYTAAEDVRKFALRRAAELALNNGYVFFTIVGEKDISRITQIQSSSKNVSLIYPGLEISIQCFQEKPEAFAVNAEEFIEYNLQT